MPVALAKMEEDNRAKREQRINKENICADSHSLRS